MDFTFGPDDTAFRAEARGWLEAHLAGEYAAAAGDRRSRQRARGRRGPPCLGARTGQGRLDRPRLGRPRQRPRQPPREPHPAGRLGRGVRPCRRPRPGRPHRREPPRPDPDRLRQRGTAAALPARRGPRRGALVPGLQRTGRRIGPRRGAHRRRARPERRPPGDRAEDLDVTGEGGRLVLRAGPHRARLQPTPRPVVPARTDGPARQDRGAADPPDVRDQRVQRGLLRRGARRGVRRRRRQRLGGRHGAAGPGTRRLHARPADRLRRRAGPGGPGGRRQRRRHRPGPARTSRTAVGAAAHHALERPAHPRLHRRPGRTQCGEAALGRLAPAPRRAGRAGQGRGGGRRPGRLVGEGTVRTRRGTAPVPVHPVRHHLRRLGRDPAEHHRRAGARPTEEPR